MTPPSMRRRGAGPDEVAERLRTPLGVGRRHRRAWAGTDRAHVEVRALHRPDGGEIARAVESALSSRDEVRWARAVPLTGRVVVHHDGMALDRIVRLVEDVEIRSHPRSSSGWAS